jgi:hypothetical protein
MIYNKNTMNEKDWAVLYTDGQYLTKRELANALHTSLVDGYWLDVKNYRGKHVKPLAHRTISNLRFFLVLTDAIQAKIQTMDLALQKLLTQLRKLDDPRQKEEVQRTLLFTILTQYAVLTKTNISPLSIKALLNGTYHEDNPAHAPIIAYLKTIRYFLDKPVEDADDDFLAEAYGSLLNTTELNKFYREHDFDKEAERASRVDGGDFHYAPFGIIDPLMGEFLTFLKEEDVPLFARAIGALYFLDLVKPFDEDNAALASLLAKEVYAQGQAGSLAFYLPFEAVIAANPRYESLYLETQHSGDLTYIVLYAIEALTPLIEKLDDDLKETRLATYRAEYKPLSPEEQALVAQHEAQKPLPNTQMSLLDELTPAAVAPSPSPVAAPAPEAVKPAPVPVTPRREEPHPIEPKPVKKVSAVPVVEESVLALETPDNPLSDKEVKEYVQYLLESNPSLNRNQASFLASHCTMGHYYTIQQFKHQARCAYETARTSMDKLAEQGYYKKEQIKNKFVYTPVKQGDK